jgi:hypothetical protein
MERLTSCELKSISGGLANKRLGSFINKLAKLGGPKKETRARGLERNDGVAEVLSFAEATIEDPPPIKRNPSPYRNIDPDDPSGCPAHLNCK